MITREFCITNEHGLHARPASLFSERASRYKSDIRVFRNEYEADGKSVISVLLLEIYPGLSMTVQISGPDEEEAMQTLAELIENDFDE